VGESTEENEAVSNVRSYIENIVLLISETDALYQYLVNLSESRKQIEDLELMNIFYPVKISFLRDYVNHIYMLFDGGSTYSMNTLIKFLSSNSASLSILDHTTSMIIMNGNNHYNIDEVIEKLSSMTPTRSTKSIHELSMVRNHITAHRSRNPIENSKVNSYNIQAGMEIIDQCKQIIHYISKIFTGQPYMSDSGKWIVQSDTKSFGGSLTNLLMSTAPKFDRIKKHSELMRKEMLHNVGDK
jgi:hypothetical protein